MGVQYMYLFLLLMFEHPEHTKMTFRIKCKVNMDDISYHDNKLEGNKRKRHKLHNIGSTLNLEKNNCDIWEWLVIVNYAHD